MYKYNYVHDVYGLMKLYLRGQSNFTSEPSRQHDKHVLRTLQSSYYHLPEILHNPAVHSPHCARTQYKYQMHMSYELALST